MKDTRKRSPWYSLWNQPPTIGGWYERKCNGVPMGMFEAIVLKYQYRSDRDITFGACEYCQWRGLAEKPGEE